MGHHRGLRASCFLAQASIFAIIAACAGDARAEEAGAPAARRPQELEEIVVTAQRREQQLMDVPVSVAAFSSQSLRSNVITDTRDLTQVAPSVSYVGGIGQNGGGFIIRGVLSSSTSGGMQQSTAFVLDGIPLARTGEFVSNLGDVERVEILRGPQGTLFGKNSTAGAVSIVTKRPTEDFEARLEGTQTTDNQSTAQGMVNLPLSDRARVRVNAYYDYLKPLLKNRFPGGDDALGFSNWGLKGKFDLDITDNLNLLVSADYNKLRNTWSTFLPIFDPMQARYIGFTPSSGRAVLNENADIGDWITMQGVSTELGWNIDPKTKVTVLTAYRKYREFNTTGDDDNTPFGLRLGRGLQYDFSNPYPLFTIINGGRTFGNSTDLHYFTQEARVNYTGDALNLVGGVFYQNLVEAGGSDLPFIQYLVSNPGRFLYNRSLSAYKVKDETRAAFGDVTWRFTDTLSAFGGARYTRERVRDTYSKTTWLAVGVTPGVDFDITTGTINRTPTRVSFQTSTKYDNVSGRIGLQFQPTPNQNFYVSYNRGYKGPAADVSLSAAVPNPTTGATPLLKPEIASSYEAGVKSTLFANRLQVSLQLYSERIKNIQQQVVPPGAITVQLITAGALKSKGGEFEFRALVADGWTIDGAVSYNDAKYGGKLANGASATIPCYAGQTVADGCVGGRTSLVGVQARGSYKWRYNVGVTYANDLRTLPFGLEARVSYAWSDDAPLVLGADPLTREGSHEMLNASLTFKADDDNWSVQIFGKNLTDDFYWNYRGSNASVGRAFGNPPRDFARYGGVKLTKTF